MRPRRRTLVPSTVVVCVLALLLGAPAALAQRTLGWTPATTPTTAFCNESPFEAIQLVTSDPSIMYQAPAAGVITSWSTQAAGGEGQQLTFKVYRPDVPFDFEYTVIAKDLRSLTPEVLNTFPVSIPVQKGDYIGLEATGASTHPTACRIHTESEEDKNVYEASDTQVGDKIELWREEEDERVNLSATLVTAPTITSLGATSGPPSGGTAVVISGTEFNEVKSVTFGTTPASFRVDSEGQITATAPAGAEGAVTVTVTNLVGSVIAPQTFTYVTPPSPSSGSSSSTGTSTPPPPAPAALAIGKSKPLTLGVGKSRLVKLTLTNTGGTATGTGSLRVKAPKGVTVKPELQKLPVIAPGKSWTISVRVELTKQAKKKSTVSLTATAAGLTAKGSLVVMRKQ